jgi:hypothetical protein
MFTFICLIEGKRWTYVAYTYWATSLNFYICTRISNKRIRKIYLQTQMWKNGFFKGPKRFLGLGFSVFLFGGRSTFASKRARLELEISTTARNVSAEFESSKRSMVLGNNYAARGCWDFILVFFSWERGFFYPPEISTPFLETSSWGFLRRGRWRSSWSLVLRMISPESEARISRSVVLLSSSTSWYNLLSAGSPFALPVVAA